MKKNEHPLERDEWGGFEEPEWAEEESTIDDDIIELVGDEEELDEEEKYEL